MKSLNMIIGNFRSRPVVLGLIISVLLIGFQPPVNAAVKAGSSCSKSGQKTKVAGVSYICTKKGSRLTWQAEKVKTASPTFDINPGQWLVGKEVKPGSYRTTSNSCYFQRLSGFGGSFDEIISNGNASGGSAMVEILASDMGFESRCSWNRIDVASLRSQITTKTHVLSGQWIVGGEVKPGTYRTIATSCYWERESGLTGTFDDIIANGSATPNGAIVTIDAGDVAFKSACEWDSI